VKRNLIYHVYPRKKSLWSWNLGQIIERRAVWNGRKLVTVALDGTTESRDDVMRELAPLDAEILFEKNDPKLGETKFFVERLAAIRSLDPGEVTFYAHTKGASQANTSTREAASKMWAQAMYVLLLDNIGFVDETLGTFASLGCFRHRIKHGGSERCYAGTFFWFRHSILFDRGWSGIDATDRYGVEGYLGRHLRMNEMATLTPDNIGPDWLYKGGVTNAKIEEWKSNWEKPMHKSVIEFLVKSIFPGDIAGKRVLEVGSYDVNGTPRSVIEPMRPAQYLGVDMGYGPGVDRVVNVNELSATLGEGTFDVVISTEMLEHVRDWKRAVIELKAVVKLGGLLVVTTRSPGFPYHPYPEDNWRYTLDDFKAIFADMEILVLESDAPGFPGVLLKARKTALARAEDVVRLNAIKLAPPKR
jgi:hypothetical protein